MRIAVSDETTTPAGELYAGRPGISGSTNWLVARFSPAWRNALERFIN